jgi:hypothetical protein
VKLEGRAPSRYVDEDQMLRKHLSLLPAASYPLRSFLPVVHVLIYCLISGRLTEKKKTYLAGDINARCKSDRIEFLCPKRTERGFGQAKLFQGGQDMCVRIDKPISSL